MSKTIYVSGPMQGYPDLNKAAFRAAEIDLRACGYSVLNPLDNGVPDGMTWADYMRADLKMVCDSQGIAVLPGWEVSHGACKEVEVARWLGIRVLPLQVWLNTEPACSVCGHVAGATWSPHWGALHAAGGHEFTTVAGA